MVSRGRAVFIGLFAFILAVGMTAPAIGAMSDDLNFGDGVADPKTAPDAYIEDNDFNKSQHPMSEGSDMGSLAGIYDDSGDWVNGSESIYVVNDTSDIETGENVNNITFKPTHMDDDSFYEFPDKAGKAWHNASAWNTSNQGNVTLSNASHDDGQEGLDVDATGISDGSLNSGGTDLYEINYSEWGTELDNDEAKRYLIVGVHVHTLDSNVNVTIKIFDESGSWKAVHIDPDRTFGDTNPATLADGTGDYFKQVQLSDLPTKGPDSTFDNPENVTINATATGTSSADSHFTLTAFDLRQKSKHVIAEQRQTTDDDGNDADGDGEYDEIQHVYNVSGATSTYHLKTLDDEFDDAVINEISYPVWIVPHNLETEANDEDYLLEWENATDFVGYDHLLNLTYRLEATEYIDASYGGNLELRLVQGWPEERYVTFEVEEGAAGSNLTDINGQSNVSALGSSENDVRDSILIDGSAQSGTEYLVQFELKLTDDDRQSVDPSFGAAAGPPSGDTGAAGGILGFGFMGDIAALAGAVAAFLLGIPQALWSRIGG